MEEVDPTLDTKPQDHTTGNLSITNIIHTFLELLGSVLDGSAELLLRVVEDLTLGGLAQTF